MSGGRARRRWTVLAAAVALTALLPGASPAQTLETQAVASAEDTVGGIAYDAAGRAYVNANVPAPPGGTAGAYLYRILVSGSQDERKVVATDGGAGDLAVGPDGLLYVCVPGKMIKQIAYGTSDFRDIAVTGCSDVLSVGPNRVFFSGGTSDTIGVIKTTESIHVAPTKVVQALAGEPTGLAVGPDGWLWVTLPGRDSVVRLHPDLDFDAVPSHKVEITLPGGAAPGQQLGPTRVVVDQGGVAWVGLGGPGSGIVRITPDGQVSAPVSIGSGHVRALVLGPDGAVWYAASGPGRIGRLSADGAVAEYPLPAGSDPVDLLARNGRIVGLAAKRLLFSLPTDVAPLLPAVSATGSTDGKVHVVLDLDARGLPTTYRIQHGPTAAYGATTDVLDGGAADGRVRREMALTGLPVGTLHYRVVAQNAFGVRLSGDQTVAVPPPPDGDGDGDPDASDCAPGNPAIHHGRPEVLDNTVNEDCAGGAEWHPLIESFFSADWTTSRGRTRVNSLAVNKVPAGARVTTLCRGRGCPFKRRASKVFRKPVAKAQFARLFRKRARGGGRRRTPVRLRAGTEVELVVSAPGVLGRWVTFHVHKDKKPVPDKPGCTAPNSIKHHACPQ